MPECGPAEAEGEEAKTGMACSEAANFLAESFVLPVDGAGTGAKEGAAADGVPKCVTVLVEPRESNRADTDLCQPTKPTSRNDAKADRGTACSAHTRRSEKKDST